MKTNEEVEKLYGYVGYFNDGFFMNAEYRAGILDALSYVLYKGEKLQRIMDKFPMQKDKPKIVQTYEEAHPECDADNPDCRCKTCQEVLDKEAKSQLTGASAKASAP